MRKPIDYTRVVPMPRGMFEVYKEGSLFGVASTPEEAAALRKLAANGQRHSL